MPRATPWPIVLALGWHSLVLAWQRAFFSPSSEECSSYLASVGGSGNCFPVKDTCAEPLVEPERRSRPVVETIGMVEQLRPGMVGHRFRLPEKVHPISAGVKGGIVGGLVMPIPAPGLRPVQWARALVSHQSAGRDGYSRTGRRFGAELEQFRLGSLILAIVIHATFSVAFGLLFGVVSPTLPPIPGGPVIAGGVLMPLLWTGLCHGFMGIVNPLLQEYVNWPWFIVSQVVYGLAMSIVVIRTEKVPSAPVGAGPKPQADFSAAGRQGGRP